MMRSFFVPTLAGYDFLLRVTSDQVSISFFVEGHQTIPAISLYSNGKRGRMSFNSAFDVSQVTGVCGSQHIFSFSPELKKVSTLLLIWSFAKFLGLHIPSLFGPVLAQEQILGSWLKGEECVFVPFPDENHRTTEVWHKKIGNRTYVALRSVYRDGSSVTRVYKVASQPFEDGVYFSYKTYKLSYLNAIEHPLGWSPHEEVDFVEGVIERNEALYQ